MKSWRVWSAISSPLALWRAWRAFEAGKRRRPDVATFGIDADRHVHHLASALAAHRWRPGGYTLLRITDPKRRLIARAPVADRVVHHAIHRALSPHIDRRFIEHSYACIDGRGLHRALMQFQRQQQRHRYLLQLDVRRYFYSIDREILRDLLFVRLPEPDTRWLLDVVLRSGSRLYTRPDVAAWLGWDAPQPPGIGLPIGNLTSQWWGNLYLDGLDHHVQRTLRPGGYQRYMDDITLFDHDPARLLACRDAVASWLSFHRNLSLKHPSAEPAPCVEPALYLGHRVTREGFSLGRKARGRLHAHVAHAAANPDRLHDTVSAFAAASMFGARWSGAGDAAALAREARAAAGLVAEERPFELSEPDDVPF